MKNLFTILLLLASFASGYSQRFAPIGAKWHYTIKPTNYFLPTWETPVVESYALLEAVEDTTILNKTCQKIVSTINMRKFDTVSYYLYSENRVVYIYNQFLNNFQVLCDYNAQKGDKWIYIHHWNSNKLTDNNDQNINLVDTFEIEVVKTQDININGSQLARLELRYQFLGGSDLHKGVLETVSIEKIGNLEFFLFPDVNFRSGVYSDDLFLHGLRCYEDPDFGFYSSGIAESCNYILLRVDRALSNIQFSVFPNPSTNKIWLQTDYTQELTIDFFNMNGQKVKAVTMVINKEVELETLPQGIYSIRVSENGVTLKTQFIVKH